MLSVQRIGNVIQREYHADALTIACQVLSVIGFDLTILIQYGSHQDGKAAGQTVPHVHFHVLPRKSSGDAFSPPSGRNDDVYPALEEHEKTLPQLHQNAQKASRPVGVDAEEDRKPRSMEEMEAEAKWLSTFFV
jgi:bis(5'-adenosyl)-triphosphatase